MEWCADCSPTEKTRAMVKILEGRKVKKKYAGRKDNGQFDYTVKNKIANGIAISVGAF